MSKVKVQDFTFNAFQENTFVVSDDQGQALIFDPGCYDSHEEQILKDYITQQGLKVLGLFNTHAHIDHVLGNHFVSQQYDCKPHLHAQDLSTLRSVGSYAHLYGFEGYKTSPEPSSDTEVSDGQIFEFGNLSFKAIHTPGHAPGHVVYYFESEGLVINGDVLFQGSFGRTDLPGGNFEVLQSTIFNTMFKLPNDTIVYCGHGPSTSIGQEKASNYILQF